MDTIHHRLMYPSPVYLTNLFDITNSQNERLFKQGIGIFFKPVGKCVKKEPKPLLTGQSPFPVPVFALLWLYSVMVASSRTNDSIVC